MKIIIVGDGKVGSILTQQLSREGHDITVIDRNSELLGTLQETYDVMAVSGNGASTQVLRTAGVAESDLLIAATSGDEINLLSCFTAKKLGCPHTVARVRNPEYAGQITFLKDELGLDMTINPEAAAAHEIYRLLQYPNFIKRDHFAKGRVEIVELRLEQDSPLAGQKLNELYKNTKVHVLVCAVERGCEVFIPSGDFEIKGGDKIYVTAETPKLAALLRVLGMPIQKIKDVVILGGSRIAYYLAKRLKSVDAHVKIIERDYERCQELSLLLPKALIIHGDACQKKLVEEETHGKADALVSLLNIDEANLVMAMFARQLGVSKVIAKIDRTEYMSVFEKFGVDSMISPKELICSDVIRYVRDMCNASGGGMLTLHRMVDSRIEALEFLAGKGTRYLDKPLHDLPLKKNLLILCIIRNGAPIFPNGDDCIHMSDSVIVAAESDQQISELNDIYL